MQCSLVFVPIVYIFFISPFISYCERVRVIIVFWLLVCHCFAHTIYWFSINLISVVLTKRVPLHCILNGRASFVFIRLFFSWFEVWCLFLIDSYFDALFFNCFLHIKAIDQFYFIQLRLFILLQINVLENYIFSFVCFWKMCILNTVFLFDSAGLFF